MYNMVGVTAVNDKMRRKPCMVSRSVSVTAVVNGDFTIRNMLLITRANKFNGGDKYTRA